MHIHKAHAANQVAIIIPLNKKIGKNNIVIITSNKNLITLILLL